MQKQMIQTYKLTKLTLRQDVFCKQLFNKYHNLLSEFVRNPTSSNWSDQTKQDLYVYDSEWTLELQASDVGLSEWAKANDLLYTL